MTIKNRRNKPGSKYPIVNGVKFYPDGKEVCQDTTEGHTEYRMRTHKMWERQRSICPLCGKPMRAQEATHDHERARGHGGAFRDDRIEVDGEWRNAAVHERCNGEKGSRRYRWVEGKYIPAVYTSPEQAELVEAAQS